MKYTLSAFLIGILFGLGLTISNMINPFKILNFLDVLGNWDPTLLVVMISALIVTFIGYRIVFRATNQPILDVKFYLPTKARIGKTLIIGSSIFGIGWGITGYCPGPGISALGTFNWDPVYFVIGLVIGSFCYYLLRPKE